MKHKNILIFISFCPLILTFNHSSAQNKPPPEAAASGFMTGSKGFFWTAGAGISAPQIDGSFSQNYHVGYNVFGSGGYILNDHTGIQGHLQYNSFGYKDASSSRLNITSFTVNLVAGNLSHSSNVNPYGVFGVGAFFLSTSTSTSFGTSTFSETNLGIRLGGGVNFKVSGQTGVFGEFTLDDNFNDSYAKGYLTFKAGVMFLP